MSIEILSTSESIRAFCADARRHPSVALDMEFERERTYRPVLQLVQLATAERAVLVDPLAGADLGPVWDLVCAPDVEILLHAGRQDMEIAYLESGGRLPVSVFDTQIAAALVGMGEQPGYADLVRRTTGVQLKKGERTTDWSRRPLSEAQQRYALDDVLYLHRIHVALLDRLEEFGRRTWLEEEVAFYGERSTYEKDPDDLWRRISRHRSLSGRALAVLRELAVWRESTAETRNVPRLRVVADDVLVDLARRSPREIEDLRSLRRLHPREIERGGEEILEAVRRGRECPEDQLPRLSKVREDDPELSVTVDLLATFVKYRAREISIAPSYLGNKKEIASFAAGHQTGRERDDTPLGRGWRHELVGRDLELFLDGQLALAVVPGEGRLELLPRNGV